MSDESTPTNMVTTLQTGSMVTISISETIFHPGHFFVALAPDIASLPADPAVTPGSTPCGSTVINTNPTLPLVADGLLVHTQSLGSSPKMFDVQLPAGMTCTNCVLEVTQFMSNHPLNNPGGCFYHHCAIVTISNNAPDAGVGPGNDAGTDPGGSAGGCCSTNRDLGGSAIAAAIVGMALLRRRRR